MRRVRRGKANLARVQIGDLTAEIPTLSLDRLGLVERQDAVATFKASGTRLVPLDAGTTPRPVEDRLCVPI